jgi:hypothetical protein
VLAFKDARKPHGDRLYQLQCMHVFHEACIKGWCVIGKKDTCPTCSERVDIKALLKTSPLWGQTSRLWGQLLDAVRYVVVWNPLIFLALRVLFYEMGIGASGKAAAPSPSPLADPQQLALPLPGDAGSGGVGAGGGGAAGLHHLSTTVAYLAEHAAMPVAAKAASHRCPSNARTSTASAAGAQDASRQESVTATPSGVDRGW